MMRNSQIALLKESREERFLPEALLHAQVEDEVKLDLRFLFDFNRDLDRNAYLSRLNEKFLDQRMVELDEHRPICTAVYEHTRARLHELLLLCASNYANNCEFCALGDLMFNPRLTLVHVSGCHEPIVKERHTTLSEQFADKGRTYEEIMLWLREETTLEIKRKPLIPHSYEILERGIYISKNYLDSARDRAVQIASLSSYLCSRGFIDSLDLDEWLRSASPKDRASTESRLLRLDWKIFQELGSLINLEACQILDPALEVTGFALLKYRKDDTPGRDDMYLRAGKEGCA